MCTGLKTKQQQKPTWTKRMLSEISLRAQGHNHVMGQV